MNSNQPGFISIMTLIAYIERVHYVCANWFPIRNSRLFPFERFKIRRTSTSSSSTRLGVCVCENWDSSVCRQGGVLNCRMINKKETKAYIVAVVVRCKRNANESISRRPSCETDPPGFLQLLTFFCYADNFSNFAQISTPFYFIFFVIHLHIKFCLVVRIAFPFYTIQLEIRCFSP